MNETHGGKRKGAGRKSKAEEQRLIEKLSPLEPIAHKALNNALNGEESWAVKLYFEYMYGKPKQRMEFDDVTPISKILTSEELKQIAKDLDDKY